MTPRAAAPAALALRESARELGRLQQSSHIAASTWRRWCQVLGLSPAQAIELWREVCCPLEKSTGQRPNISYLMRLRAARSTLDIEEFKGEVAPLRHLLGFFRLLRDEDLGGGELSTAVLRYYRHALGDTLLRPPFSRFIEQFVGDVCRAFLIVKLARAPQVSLSRVLHLLSDGRADLDRLVELALQDGHGPEEAVTRFLRLRADSAAAFFALFADILRSFYAGERGADPALLESRLRALHAFAPLRARLPSSGEAPPGTALAA